METISRKEILVKEIDLIQGCINRMASNSFMLKGWTVALVGIIVAAFSNKDNFRIICGMSSVICFIFWWLDAFFLKMEKLFRKKYSWVIKNRLSTNEYMFNLNPYEREMWLSTDSQDISLFSVMFSKTLCPFYLTLMVMIVFGIVRFA